MPIVTIQITRERTEPGADSATTEQKAALIHGVSKLLLDVLEKPMDPTFVVIDEAETDNWGRGGLPVDQFRAGQGSRIPDSPGASGRGGPAAPITGSPAPAAAVRSNDRRRTWHKWALCPL
jgi:4-oxalocrotonate tautomerase